MGGYNYLRAVQSSVCYGDVLCRVDVELYIGRFGVSLCGVVARFWLKISNFVAIHTNAVDGGFGHRCGLVGDGVGEARRSVGRSYRYLRRASEHRFGYSVGLPIYIALESQLRCFGGASGQRVRVGEGCALESRQWRAVECDVFQRGIARCGACEGNFVGGYGFVFGFHSDGSAAPAVVRHQHGLRFVAFFVTNGWQCRRVGQFHGVVERFGRKICYGRAVYQNVAEQTIAVQCAVGKENGVDVRVANFGRYGDFGRAEQRGFHNAHTLTFVFLYTDVRANFYDCSVEQIGVFVGLRVEVWQCHAADVNLVQQAVRRFFHRE